MDFGGNYYEAMLAAWWVALGLAGFHAFWIYRVKRYIREMQTEHVQLEAENRALRVIISGQKKIMETMSLAMIRKPETKPKEQKCNTQQNSPESSPASVYISKENKTELR